MIAFLDGFVVAAFCLSVAGLTILGLGLLYLEMVKAFGPAAAYAVYTIVILSTIYGAFCAWKGKQ